MTSELRALLERIEAAGGPFKRHGDIHYEYTGHVRAGAFTCCPEGQWCFWDSACLIAALKADARARGARPRAWLDGCDCTTPECSSNFCNNEWVCLVLPGRSPWADHPDEATAWCLAWLTAFEQEADQ